MRARTWPATLRSPIKGYWSAADRARQHIARHTAETGPDNVAPRLQAVGMDSIVKALRDIVIIPGPSGGEGA